MGSDGKIIHGLTRLANSDIWNENRFDEIKDRQIITICRIQQFHLLTGKDFGFTGSDGKIIHDLTRLANSDIWNKNRFDEIKDRQIITICRIQRLHLITGTVALVEITKQTRIYHYKW